MPLIMTNLPLGLNDPEEAVFSTVLKKLNLSRNEVADIHIYKRSLDARKQNNIHFVVSVQLRLHEHEEMVFAQYRGNNLQHRPAVQYAIPTDVSLPDRPIIVGFGPAGLFCAYLLAKAGCRPIVLERGGAIEERVSAIDGFWKQGILNPECNVQFGEGGAGTFSDGKLTTRISDPRCSFVLSVFQQFGAPDEILTKAKPHIGTDKLRQVIINMRQEILRLGGEVFFHHRLEDLHFHQKKLQKITVNGAEMSASCLVLAIGHSARDTFSMLLSRGMHLLPKSFSVGARIEHLQSQIDVGLYGNLAGHPNLPQGEYQLSHREQNRAAYTFCMCPGGTVVPAASSPETVVVNGMSEFARNGNNANAALVVSVDPTDFGTHPLDGIRFQEQLERTAFLAGGSNYQAPAVTVGDFLNRQARLRLDTVLPSYSLGVQAADFDAILPSYVTDMMRKGLQVFHRKLPGYAAADAVLTGVETRTSSPVRIVRQENFTADGLAGIYPCGEGAGYAGGIMSAAVDGLRIAEEILASASQKR